MALNTVKELNDQNNIKDIKTLAESTLSNMNNIFNINLILFHFSKKLKKNSDLKTNHLI